jgi:hypothetical protein
MKETHYTEFNTIFIEAFEQGIRDLLGSDVLSSLYVALERSHNVTRDDLPNRFDVAYVLLEHVLGVGASRRICMGMVRRLYRKLNLEFHDNPNLTLADYIDNAKRIDTRERIAKPECKLENT